MTYFYPFQDCRIVAVIPARMNSKGLPQKNLLLLNGKPIFRYSIETALNVESIQQVIVTTDSPDILLNIQKSNVVSRSRPSNLAEDFSTDIEFLVDLLEENLVQETDIIVLLRPTHPLRKPETVEKAISKFVRSSHYTSLRSMKKSKENVFKSWIIDSSETARSVYDSSLTNVIDPCNAPRQLLPQTYFQDGYVDIFPMSTVVAHQSTTGPRVLPFIIDEFSHDIDSIEDLKVIEAEIQRQSIANN